MASALSTFNDFVETTGPAYLTSAESVVNEAGKNNYLLRRFIRGKSTEELIQGGSTIKDTIMFDEDSTFQYYQPNETFTWQNPQVLTSWEINWRFSVDHMSYTDQEIELSISSGMTKAARHHMYKKLKRTKEQRMWTSVFNGMENALFAVPEVADQETNTGLKPYSIPAFLNENTNGLFYSGAAPTGKTAWTTVEGLNPTTYSKWVPQQGTYGSVDPTDTGATAATTNLFMAMDKMFLDVQFVPPPTAQEYFENPTLNAMFVACSKAGQRVYQNMLRVAQDTFVSTSRQDPSYMSPKISGMDLVYTPALDTAALYQATTSTNPYVAEIDGGGGGATVAEDTGPRFYFINANYIKPVFHTSRYMYKHSPMRHPNQPFTTIVPVDTWCNLVCRSRQRQGILSPSGDVVTS